MTTSDDSQTTPLHGPNLILDVENFGPIAEAKNIEFKPMTVLVGPSNTGKTYLAMLLHAAILAKKTADSEVSIWGDASDPIQDPYEDPDFQDFVDDVSKIFEQIFVQGISIDTKLALKIPASEFSIEGRRYLVKSTYRYLHEFAAAANRSVKRFFDVADLTALTPAGGDMSFRLRLESRERHSNIDVSLHDVVVSKFDIAASFETAFNVGERVTSSKRAIDIFFEDEHYMYATIDFVEAVLCHMPFSHYFRAGRTGLIDAYRELAATLIERATSNSRRERTDKQLAVSVATSEFLQSIVRLSSGSIRQSKSPNLSKLADVLEKSVLRGKINVKETAGITYFEFEKDGVAVPLDRASSMVTELAPIILFIRGFVRDGDLLIIDEPEAHLHPEAQQQMAAALAFMVRSGLRVLITTHSHYMVEQLSAFVNASKLDETTRKRALSLGGALGKEDIYLNEDETAVYGFDQPNADGGTVVYEIPLGEQREYSPRDHSVAVNKQYNRLQRVLEAREGFDV